MFDSNTYEWADVSLILAGRDVIEIRRVKYTRKAEKEPLYAKGSKPHAIKTGNYSYDCEFEMVDAGYDKLVDASPFRDVTRLKGTSAVIVFGNPLEGKLPRTITILGVEFTESGKESSQGDKMTVVTLPGIALDIAE